MIKKSFFILTIALGILFAFNVHAFELQANAQCVGGTLINSYTDVQDGGGLAVYTNAKMLAQSDCAMLTPAGACCSVHVSTNGGGFGGNIIPYTWFNYEIYRGATVESGHASYQTGPLANAPGTGGNSKGSVGRQGKYFAGPAAPTTNTPSPTTPAAITAALVANPSSIESGGSSLLTWSSTGATTCTGNFPTNGATSGSVSVSPSATTEYTVTCTDGPVSGGGGSCLADGEEVPAGHLCSEDRTISPPLSSITWDQCCSGVARTQCPAPNEPAEAYCSRSGSGAAGGTTSGTSGTPVRSAVASARVIVSDGTFQASCRAHPTRAGVGEDVLWSSTVSGPQGTYAYSWSGTDGLSGNANQIFKKYSSTGRKTAALTVTYTPGEQAVLPPTTTTESTVDTPPTGSVTGGQSGTGGGTEPPLYLHYWNTLTNFLLFDRTDQQFDPNNVETVKMIEGTVQGATASIVPHTEGEMFTSAPVKADMLTNGGVAFTETTFVGRTLASDQATMDRVCVVLHGAGSTATRIGARGYNSCKNNGIIRYSAGRWESVSGCAGAHLSGSFSCLAPAPAPTAGSCTLTITPSVVVAGQSATLSWVSTGLSSLTIDHGVGTVTGASGSKTITPTASGAYTATGVSSDSSTNFSIQSAHSSIISAMTQDTARYGIAYNTSYGIYADPATITHICEQVFGPGAVQQQYDITAFNSCGNNQILKWDGSRWVAFGACQDNRKMLRVLDCKVPQVSNAPSVQCAAATVTVTQPVAQSITKTVQCDNAVTIGNAECSDGLDNDQDGLADAEDPECLTGGGDDDDGNGGTYDPNGGSESGGTGATQCSDGIDNNGDGNADWPDDPGCSSADDNLEFVEPSELTLTSNPPLIKKNQQCTITVSARNVASCTLTGSGVSRAFTVVNGVVSTSEVVTPALTQTSTYTLSCRGLDGKTATKKVDCKIAPTFEEI